MKGTCVLVVVAVVAGGLGCAGTGVSSTPKSVREYAANLPSRADGEYNLLEEPIKKVLVTQDASLQCKIDLEDKQAAETSAACKCFQSASADWVHDCGPWLGAHTPHAAN